MLSQKQAEGKQRTSAPALTSTIEGLKSTTKADRVHSTPPTNTSPTRRNILGTPGSNPNQRYSHMARGRHQPLPRRDQCRTKTLHVDRRPGQNHLRRQTRAPSVRFHPLVGVPRAFGGHWGTESFARAADKGDIISVPKIPEAQRGIIDANRGFASQKRGTIRL